jgi:hypothetical protein
VEAANVSLSGSTSRAEDEVMGDWASTVSRLSSCGGVADVLLTLADCDRGVRCRGRRNARSASSSPRLGKLHSVFARRQRSQGGIPPWLTHFVLSRLQCRQALETRLKIWAGVISGAGCCPISIVRFLTAWVESGMGKEQNGDALPRYLSCLPDPLAIQSAPRTGR